MTKIILFSLCFSLSGCVGSYLVFEDRNPKDFETLHAVPDRYKFTPQSNHLQEEERLKKEHQKNLHDAEEIKKKAHLLETESLQSAPSKEK